MLSLLLIQIRWVVPLISSSLFINSDHMRLNKISEKLLNIISNDYIIITIFNLHLQNYMLQLLIGLHTNNNTWKSYILCIYTYYCLNP